MRPAHSPNVHFSVPQATPAAPLFKVDVGARYPFNTPKDRAFQASPAAFEGGVNADYSSAYSNPPHSSTQHSYTPHLPYPDSVYSLTASVNGPYAPTAVPVPMPSHPPHNANYNSHEQHFPDPPYPVERQPNASDHNFQNYSRPAGAYHRHSAHGYVSTNPLPLPQAGGAYGSAGYDPNTGYGYQEYRQGGQQQPQDPYEYTDPDRQPYVVMPPFPHAEEPPATQAAQDLENRRSGQHPYGL